MFLVHVKVYLRLLKDERQKFLVGNFLTPTHGVLIFFDAYSLYLEIFSTPPTFDSGPPAINNDWSFMIIISMQKM